MRLQQKAMYNTHMRIVGIDPGFGRMGWGIVEEKSGKVEPIEYGCLETSPKKELGERLREVYLFVEELIKNYHPEALAIEDLFFNTNAKTAFAVGQARGVIILAATLNNISVTTYTPLQVKIAIAGYGRAEKGQIGQMVKIALKLDSIPKLDDTTDALAIALTHSFSKKIRSLEKR
jgi:crossover junction endodeoxyribonuclease RuvC